MIALWLLHAVFVGLLLCVAGLVLERGARLVRLPVRWIWLSGLVALVFLMVRAPAVPNVLPAVEIRVAAAEDGTLAVVPPGAVPMGAGSALVESVRTVMGAPLRVAAAGTAAETRDVIGRVFVATWLLTSVGLLLLLRATCRRYRRARRSWPTRRVDGVTVRVAPAAGPAVVGLIRPEIVVPAWLLDAPSGERRLILAHEGEHLQAGDNALLALGCLLVALLPWHPAVWWMAARLRLAVELDCDARVLRRGAEPALYGSLLLAIAGRPARLPFGAPALVESPSHLERRIMAMTHRAPRFAAARGGILAGCASLFVFAACETALPTGPEMDALDVAAVEQRAEKLGFALGDDGRYYLDGVAIDGEQARRLATEQIAGIEVVLQRGDLAADGSAVEAAPTIRITSADAAARRNAVRVVASAAERSRVVEGASIDDGARVENGTRVVTAVPVSRGFDGILVIDDQRADPGALSRLDPDMIETIEVIKGAAAARLFAEPAARNGVIRIVTRTAPSNR